jgi:hypothetical protein
MEAKMAIRKVYTVWSFNVWGNAKDGYEVNDRSNEGSIELPENCTDNQIIKALKDSGYLKKGKHTSSFDIGGDDMVITIDWAKDSYPLFSLELEA